jgi:ATP-dependent Clp protease protease subunit
MASDMKIQVEEILKMKKSLTDIYVRHNSAGKTFEEFETMMDRDTFLSAEEALEWGLVDEVITKRP